MGDKERYLDKDGNAVDRLSGPSHISAGTNSSLGTFINTTKKFIKNLFEQKKYQDSMIEYQKNKKQYEKEKKDYDDRIKEAAEDGIIIIL